MVLTGINLGCFRDRSAGYDLARLVREAGETPGLERLRLSSIEINHVNDALVAALRETPTVSKHLHVPLQSGDDGVLRAMRRRYTVDTYLRRLAPLAGEFNLTSDVIVGFPAEDDAAFATTMRTIERAGITKVHVFPYSPRPGTVTAADDPVPPRVKKERGAALRALSHELCATALEPQGGGRGARRPSGPRLRRRLHAVARRCAGRGARPRARRRASPRRASLLQRDDCLFCVLVRDGDHVHRGDGFVAIDDINPKAPVHVLVIPERHVDTFREVGEFDPDEAKRMLEFVAETARIDRPGGLPGRRQRRSGRWTDGFSPALAYPRRPDDAGDGSVSLIGELEDEVKDAMRAHDNERRDALRLILSSLKSAEKELLRPLSDDEELQVLQRERKKRQEAAEAFRSGGREDRAEQEEAELAVLEEFMPEPLAEEDLERIVDDAIAENKATSMRDMGRVMADVMPQIAGRADGSAVSQLVREKLA